MWDLKLQTLEFFFFSSSNVKGFLITLLNSIDPVFYNGFFIFNWKIYYQFVQNMSFFFGIKFLLAIAFLILIRGGTPRYRYDYLTKLGWLKFLGLVIVVFFFHF